MTDLSKTKKSFADHWNYFWFRPSETDTLCLLRLFFGVVMFFRFTGFYGLYRIDKMHMNFPRSSIDVVNLLDDGVFRMPYPGFEWLPVPSPELFHCFEWSLMVLSVFIMLGLFTRAAIPLFASLFTYLHLLSMFSYRHHYLCMFIVIWVLALCSCGWRYSVDALLRDPEKPRPKTTMMPLRIIQMMVCFMYFFTFLSKLNEGWFTGEILRVFEESGSIEATFKEATFAVVSFQQLSVATLIIEGFIPFGFMFSKTRRASIFLGLSLHIGIDSLMRVATFGMQMSVLYIIFIYPQAKSTKVIYDDKSSEGRRQRRWFTVLNWLDRFDWIDTRSKEAKSILFEEKAVIRGKNLVVVTSAGVVKKGFAAWRHLVNSCPLTFMPSAVLYIPPVTILAKKIYKNLHA